MRFSLDVIRARKGDCLLLHYGTATEPRLIIIDGGPANVYKPQLRRRIEKIRTARRLDDNASLPVDIVMVSHVDDDDIKGVLDLTKELRIQKKNGEPQLLKVATLWHNCFDDLLSTTPDQLQAHVGFGAAAVDGAIDLGDEELDAAKVLASIPQGRTLRDDAAFLGDDGRGWKVNAQFKGQLILATDNAQPVPLTGGLTMTVIGPMQAELAALQKEHDEWVKKHVAQPSAGASTLAAFVDRSVTNLSSIVLLAEAGGKRMLLTGDARGDKILDGLEKAGLLGADPTSTMHVDVLKVPHHGSANNMETIFFKRVTADFYVFSGNGEHGNPERETIEMLFEARGDAAFTAVFTYEIDAIDRERQNDWKKEQAKEAARGRPQRPQWSAEKNSLRSFFDHHPLAPGQRIVEMPDDDSPQVVNLLEAVGI